MNERLGLLLLVLLLLLPSISFAALVSYGGQCYASELDARDAFLREYPKVASELNPPLLRTITANTLAGPVLTYTMTSKPFNSTTVTTYTGQTITFPACTSIWMTMQSVMILAVGFICVAIGFMFSKWRF